MWEVRAQLVDSVDTVDSVDSVGKVWVGWGKIPCQPLLVCRLCVGCG